MSKLHKTSYQSRQPNYNNFLSDSQGLKEGQKSNDIKSSTIHRKQIDHDPIYIKCEQKPISRQIQKKIQIDSSLLFNVKKNSRNSSRPAENGVRGSINRTESKFYQNLLHKQRPKSKQEPRVKINLDPDMRTYMQFPERPQTSKGIRPHKYIEDIRKRKMSFQNNESNINVAYKEIDRRAMISSSQSRRPSKKYNFQTSIDPEFLNLFAAH